MHVGACTNSPISVTLAGDETAIDALKLKLVEDGIFARKLRVSVAYQPPHVKQFTVRIPLIWALESGEQLPAQRYCLP